MGRLIAIVLGGAALALYVPLFFPDVLSSVSDLWVKLLGDDWYLKLIGAGPGVFAGLALVLLAIRGRD